MTRAFLFAIAFALMFFSAEAFILSLQQTIAPPRSWMEVVTKPAFFQSSKDEFYEQQQNESHMDFINRISNDKPPTPRKKYIPFTATEDASPSGSEPVPKETTMTTAAAVAEAPPVSGYQRIEEWEADRKAKGYLSWEERVQYDGQQFGDQIRQNDIVLRQINGGI